MKILQNKNNLIIILGFIIFTLYFWNKFIRPRTSKELPLELTVLKFFTILYVCIIFTYILISVIFPRKSNDIIEKIMEWLFTPIEEFDNYLKSFTQIKNYYDKFITYLLPKLDYLIIKTNMLFIILWIIPRIIMLTAFWIDVFIFNQLHYKYYVLLFGLFLFFNRYFKFSLINYKKYLIENNKNYLDAVETPYVSGIHPAELDPDYDPNDPDEADILEFMFLPFDIFIKFSTESLVYNNIIRKYDRITTKEQLRKDLWQEHIQEPYIGFYDDKDVPKDYKNIFGDKIPDNYNQATHLVNKKIDEYTLITLKKMLQISLIIEYYKKNINQNPKIKNIKILMYSNTLICWLYILIISLHTLDLNELVITLLKTWLTLQDPFSEDFIFDL